MNIFKDGILVDIDVSFWSGAKMLTAEDLGLNEQDIAEAYKLGQKMLIPREVIKKFRAIESKARHLVEINSFKFPIGNARFIPKKNFSKIHAKLKKLQQEYDGEVEGLIINYDKYRSEMLPIYKKAAEQAYMNQLPSEHSFSIEDMETEKDHFVNNFLMRISTFYPPAETLRHRFSLTWDVYEIALPRMKKTSEEEIEKQIIAGEEYRIQAQEKIGKFLDDVVHTLRDETLDVCNRIIKNIKEGKIVKGQTIQSLKKFVEKFSELNFVEDRKVEEQLESLRKDFLESHSTVEIAEQTDLQTELSRRLGKLAEVASDMTDINSVTGEYKRKILWD